MSDEEKQKIEQDVLKVLEKEKIMIEIDEISDHIDSIFEESYLPKLIKKELILYIISNRVDELTFTDVFVNKHGATFVTRKDSNGREVNKNERLVQLNNSMDSISKDHIWN